MGDNVVVTILPSNGTQDHELLPDAEELRLLEFISSDTDSIVFVKPEIIIFSEHAHVTPIWYKYDKLLNEWFWTPYSEKEQNWISVLDLTVPYGMWTGAQPHMINVMIIHYLLGHKPVPVEVVSAEVENVNDIMHCVVEVVSE